MSEHAAIMVTLPEFCVVEHLPCTNCRCTTFCNFEYVGPHILGKCRDCQTVKRWFKRADLGLSSRQRQRRGSIDRSEVLARWHHRCAWCGISAATLEAYGEELVVGHIVPYHVLHELPDIRDHPANLAASCNACNDYAHKIGREHFDLSILLHAAVAYAAGTLGGHENAGDGQTDHDPGPVRAEIRGARMGSIPVPRERQAPDSGARAQGRDDGWGDDPPTLA